MESGLWRDYFACFCSILPVRKAPSNCPLNCQVVLLLYPWAEKPTQGQTGGDRGLKRKSAIPNL